MKASCEYYWTNPIGRTANEDDNLTTELEKYWKKHSEESIDALQPHLNSPRQNIADLPLPRHHPGHAIVEILDLLGPLLFPLYRAALLRHRILILKKPPVELSCHLGMPLNEMNAVRIRAHLNSVYILSTLAALAESRSPPAITGDTQSTALFNIGVNDISYVQSRIPQRSPRTTNEPSPCRGWIACTSDVLIATKTTLYDLKLNFPSSPASQPTIHRSSGDKAKVKASQRDLRRYLRLRKALSSIGTDRTFSDESQDDSENAALLRTYTNVSQTHVPSPPEMDAYNDSTDALPWPAAAYEMFKSWASGGEATAALEAEAEHDGELLRGQSNVNYETESLRQPSRRGTPNLDVSPDTSPYELVVAYFHAWTDSIIGTLSQIVDSEAAARTPVDDDNEETRSRGHIRVTVEGLVDMGLDVWSESDKEFVRDMVRTYFDVEADVEGGSVDLCGVKVY